MTPDQVFSQLKEMPVNPDYQRGYDAGKIEGKGDANRMYSNELARQYDLTYADAYLDCERDGYAGYKNLTWRFFALSGAVSWVGVVIAVIEAVV